MVFHSLIVRIYILQRKFNFNCFIAFAQTSIWNSTFKFFNTHFLWWFSFSRFFCPFKMAINRIDEIGNYTMYDFNTYLVDIIVHHSNFVFSIIISCFSPKSFECKHIFPIQTMDQSWMPVCLSFYFAHTHSFSNTVLCNG